MPHPIISLIKTKGKHSPITSVIILFIALPRLVSGFIAGKSYDGFQNRHENAAALSNRIPISNRGGGKVAKRRRHPTAPIISNSNANNIKPANIAGATTTSSTVLGCQLLGMNCATPTDFTPSFKAFCERGGKTDIHSDGWGVAFYEEKGMRQFHDSSPASYSPMASFLSSSGPVRTMNMMSHLRYATVGEVGLSNVHPFVREMWGINFSFAMNGDVPLFKKTPDAELESLQEEKIDDSHSPRGKNKDERYYHPVGDTDSRPPFAPC